MGRGGGELNADISMQNSLTPFIFRLGSCSTLAIPSLPDMTPTYFLNNLCLSILLLSWYCPGVILKQKELNNFLDNLPKV